jgi:hypothetical protein
MPGTMHNIKDANGCRFNTVKNEVIRKSTHRQHSHGLQSRMSGSIYNPARRVFGNLLECGFDSL